MRKEPNAAVPEQKERREKIDRIKNGYKWDVWTDVIAKCPSKSGRNWPSTATLLGGRKVPTL